MSSPKTTIIPGSIPATSDTQHSTSINHPPNTALATEAVVTTPIDEAPTLEAAAPPTSSSSSSSSSSSHSDNENLPAKKNAEKSSPKKKGKKLCSSAKKFVHDVTDESEIFLKRALQNFSYFFSNLNTVTKDVTALVSTRAAALAKRALEEIQNPVVATHFVGGVLLVSSVLNQYANKHSRYLAGKSDKEVLLIAGTATAASIADIYLFKKLYPKYKKE